MRRCPPIIVKSSRILVNSTLSYTCFISDRSEASVVVRLSRFALTLPKLLPDLLILAILRAR